MKHGRKVKTTLGDLIVALTDETRVFVRDEKVAYGVVADIVSKFLSSARISSRKRR